LTDHETYDLNVHDTYFIIAKFHIAILTSILFGTIGLGYWIMAKLDRKTSKWMSIIHTSLTIGGLFLIWTLSSLNLNSKSGSGIAIFDSIDFLELLIFLIALIAILAQILFPINLVLSIFRKKTKNCG